MIREDETNQPSNHLGEKDHSEYHPTVESQDGHDSQVVQLFVFHAYLTGPIFIWWLGPMFQETKDYISETCWAEIIITLFHNMLNSL